MAVIDTADLSAVALDFTAQSLIRGIFKQEIWKWFHQHQDDTLFKKWFISVHVHDLLPLFVALVGNEYSS